MLETTLAGQDVLIPIHFRLNVLRALIAEVNNAAKTTSPIQTDIQLLQLIRKREGASREAAAQFAEENRMDLKEKEEAQLTVLGQYADQVYVMDIEEVKAIIEKEIDSQTKPGEELKPGLILKNLFSKGGTLDSKPVDRASVAQLVTKALSERGPR